MQETIQSYLTDTQAYLGRKRDPLAHFSLPAVKRLMASRAYQTKDWLSLKKLAEDLKALNLAEISVARKYPDVFHENVILSRQAENLIYSAVIKLVDRQALDAA